MIEWLLGAGTAGRELAEGPVCWPSVLIAFV